MDKTWVEGKPSAYQQHDIVHFPDWKNIIVWDLFFNNLTSGFMFVTMITWLVAPDVFGPVLPIALTLAFLIVIFDLRCSSPTSVTTSGFCTPCASCIRRPPCRSAW